MKFGIFSLFSRPEGSNDRDVLRDTVEMVKRTEDLGYDCVWMAEHHFVPYGIVGSPLMMAAHLAAHTKSIKLGMAVTILPFQHPLRTAEDAALVDALSDGRLEFGVGRGYSAIEYTGLGVEMDESKERFRECLDIIKLAWQSSDPFDYQGKYYQVNDRLTNPRPLRPPPIWVAATSPPTLTWAAEEGYPYLQDHMVPFDGIVSSRATYANAVKERIGDQSEVERLLQQSAVLRMVYVDESDKRAAETARPRLEWYQQSLNRFGSSARDGSYSKAYEYQKQLNQQQQARDFDWYQQNSTIFGSPSQVVDRLQALNEQSGIERFITWMNFGGIPQEDALNSLSLFSEKVMARLG